MNQKDEHLLEFQLKLHYHFFMKFSDNMTLYRNDILTLYFNGCNSIYDPLRYQSLKLLHEYVLNIQSEIKENESLMKQLLDSMLIVTPKMTDCVLYVEITTS